MTKFAIVAKCNPFNAPTHYHGEKVLKRTVLTPIHWVLADRYYDTAEEAKEVLIQNCLSENENYCLLDAAELPIMVNNAMGNYNLRYARDILDVFIANGECVFDTESETCVMSILKDDGYSYDTMSYSIEEIEVEE